MNGCVSKFDTEVGVLGITSNGRSITGIYFPGESLPDLEIGEDALISEAISQLSEYFSGTRRIFDLPVEQPGTEFQQSVWNAMLDIGYGETSTYGRIAEGIGRPNAYRAVGSACGLNRIPIIIPCHRIVASSGIGGYAGGLDLKRRLLELEARNK